MKVNCVKKCFMRNHNKRISDDNYFYEIKYSIDFTLHELSILRNISLEYNHDFKCLLFYVSINNEDKKRTLNEFSVCKTTESISVNYRERDEQIELDAFLNAHVKYESDFIVMRFSPCILYCGLTFKTCTYDRAFDFLKSMSLCEGQIRSKLDFLKDFEINNSTDDFVSF